MADSSNIIITRTDASAECLVEEESIEGRLLAAVATVFGLDRHCIQLLDSFVGLGGKQESAVALRKACMDMGMALKTKDILRCETLAELQTCITPCARQCVCPETIESVMIAPVEIHRASRLSVTEDRKNSHSRHSSNSSAATDTQPKTEVEGVLTAHKLVSRIITTKPKAGLLEGKLVAFLTLTNIEPVPCDNSDVRLISMSQMFFAGTQVATLRRIVEASSHAEFVPQVWIVLNEMPVADSGEIERRRLRTWAQNINEDTYRQIMSLDTKETLQTPSNEMERSLQRLAGKVLQVPQEQIGVNFSFSQLGGDEMTATEFVARCKHESIYLNVNEILQGAALTELAALASQRGGLAHKWEDDSGGMGCFDLSPMQQLYFSTAMGGNGQLRAAADGSYRFNQSLLLRLRKHYTLEDIRAAVEAVVGHHPMLRSRFTSEGNCWSQSIRPEVSRSYAFTSHFVRSNDDFEAVIQGVQATIDIQNGPVFAASYFHTSDGQHLIYIAAHHLAVDLPSWRVIIHDLDELLDSGSLLSQRSMPFQKWIELQKTAALKSVQDLALLPAPAHDQTYWGLNKLPNTYGDAVETSFSLSPELTSILQSSCNQVFRTDSVDIYLAALMLSFAQTFTDRPLPVVWNQEHGREPWSPEIDISETVGWFTSLCPITQRVDGSEDFVQVLRRIKDIRRSSLYRGSRALTTRLYHPEERDSLSFDNPFEVVFSYAGSLQHLERDNGVLEQVAIPGRTLASRTSDIGPSVGRIAVFEVNTMVDQGNAKIKFLYNRYSRHQDRISAWISNYEHLLLEAIGRLRYHRHELTLSDIPYLDVTYEGLAKLNKNRLDVLNIPNIWDIEGVYPVTATQQHILANQARDSEAYFHHAVHEFAAPTGEVVDVSRICAAWQLVTNRHTALRTVFMESVTQTGLYDQILLRKVSPDMLFIDSIPPEDPLDELNDLPAVGAHHAKPPHRLAVCKTPTKTLVKIDISAAICDASSIENLLGDLWRTYATQRAIPDPVQLSYANYLEFLRVARQGESLGYWRNHLAHVQPCLFPKLTSRSDDPKRANTFLELDVSSQDIATFTKDHEISSEAIIRLAWALLLRSFTGATNTCFGYLTSGRDGLVEGLGQAVGSFANTIPCFIRLSSYSSVLSTLRLIDEELRSSLPHQYISLSEIEHALGRKGGSHLFNSCLSYGGVHADLSSKFSVQTNFELKLVSQQQTSDFDIAMHVRHFNGKLAADLSFNIMSSEQAMNVGHTFGQAVQAILCSSNGSIGDISLFSDRDYAQIISWGGGLTDQELEQCRIVVHELVAGNATRNLDAQAICSWDGDLSYREMIDNATKLAHHLVDCGVGPRAVVPVVLEKSRWAPVAMLAVLKTGAAFVPIDAEELGSLQTIFEQLNAKVAIASGLVAPILRNLFEKVITLNDTLFAHTPERHEVLPSITTDYTACIFFTTSSSGDVRGVAFSHVALSTAFLAQGRALRISPQSRVMQLSSFNVDIALSEVFVTLVYGGCVCVPSATERLEGFATAAQRMRVNWTYMTPVLSRKLDPTLLPSLRVVCFRTRSLDDDTYAPWSGKVNVILAYGAPEVCPLGISFLDVIGPYHLRSIGRPLAGNFWVVDHDDHRNLMPIGAVGELVIEGPTLGSPHPDVDSIQSPVGESEGNASPKTRFFKTGHRVRYLESGVIEFVSSKRERLEMDGRIVNLTEIEQHIRRCLGRGANVMVEAIAFRGANAVPVLAAFLELGEMVVDETFDLTQLTLAVKEGLHVAKQLIQTGLKTSIPSHLIPSVFVPVKRFPITPSLKVNRRQLQKIIQGLSKEQLLSLADVPSPANVQSIDLKPLPLTRAEEEMRGIWAEVLGIDPTTIGPADGFFHAGGDEVLAAKLVVACRHKGIVVSIADILNKFTLTELCRSTASESPLPEHYSPDSSVPGPLTVLQAVTQKGSPTEAFVEKIVAPKMGVDRQSIKEVAETSSMQTRYIETAMLRGRANIDYFLLSFTGSVDHKKLEEACQVLAIIHPILRTAFIPHNRRVYQAVIKSFSLSFKRYSCPSWRVTAMTEKALRKDQSAPVAFNQPMTKFVLVDGGKQSTLIMRLCKAQYDDLSIAVLVKDLKRLYDGTQNPPRRPSYCEFITSVHLANSLGAEQYWRTLLDGATMTQIVGHSKPYQLSINVQTVQQKLLVGSLSNLGISFETILKSAWAMVLATLSGSSDVVFGELIEGRHVRLPGGSSVAGVLGPTINSIPVRIQFPDVPMSPLGLLEYVHGQRIAGIPFENLGFLNIVEQCTPWPYWTQLSSVVQHQYEETTIKPKEPKVFHLGSATCRLSLLEPRARDVQDFFVHSVMLPQGRVELGITFCADRVPESLAEHALRLLGETVALLTSVSIMQPIIPSGQQYRTLPKCIPIPETLAGSAMSPQVASATTPPLIAPAKLPSQDQQRQQEEQQSPSGPASLVPRDQKRAIQTIIAESWAKTLDPRPLGVPEEHAHTAAFYDLWGSLIPAAQLAAQLNRELVPKLGVPAVAMEEIIDHPTMLAQYELIAAKMASVSAPSTKKKKEKPSPSTPMVTSTPSLTTSTPVSPPPARKKPALSVSGSAASIGKSIRKLANSVTRSPPTKPSSQPTGEPATPATPATPALATPETPVALLEATPDHAPQLPALPAFFPVAEIDESEEGSPGRCGSGSHGNSWGGRSRSGSGSGKTSTAGSMTTGSSASSHHSGDGDDNEGDDLADERADVLSPLRTFNNCSGMSLQTKGIARIGPVVGDEESLVSPLSSVSDKNSLRFWDPASVGAAATSSSGSGGRRKGSVSGPARTLVKTAAVSPVTD